MDEEAEPPGFAPVAEATARQPNAVPFRLE